MWGAIGTFLVVHQPFFLKSQPKQDLEQKRAERFFVAVSPPLGSFLESGGAMERARGNSRNPNVRYWHQSGHAAIAIVLMYDPANGGTITKSKT
jgi:hypothetical protein